jgi:hypothetical protein
MTLTRPRFGLIPLVYLVVGAVVAATHHYFEHVDTLQTVGSAILAVLFWPLIFLGIDLHIHR